MTTYCDIMELILRRNVGDYMWIWLIACILFIGKLSSIGIPSTVIALMVVLFVISKCFNNYEDKSRRNRWWN
jgi:hypothetical protein